MAEKTGIQWTEHTFNPWWGCTKVSPGCDNCYAETLDRMRYKEGERHWGKGAPRKPASENSWREVEKWDRAAARSRTRTFSASMADLFDEEAPPGALDRFWQVARRCLHTDFQLLTKRPERILTSLPADWGKGYPNVLLGTSVEDQKRALWRMPDLITAPAHLRFVSTEPLLGSVDLRQWLRLPGRPIRWLIVGGESGSARPTDPAWARDLLAQCRESGVAFFMKQMGDLGIVQLGRKRSQDGDLESFPVDLRVREFPCSWCGVAIPPGRQRTCSPSCRTQLARALPREEQRSRAA